MCSSDLEQLAHFIDSTPSIMAAIQEQSLGLIAEYQRRTPPEIQERVARIVEQGVSTLAALAGQALQGTLQTVTATIGFVFGLAVMPFDAARRRFRLASVHPGHTADEVRDATGFDFDMPAQVPTTKVPDAGTLGLLRGPIADKLREFYPDFADRVFPVPA